MAITCSGANMCHMAVGARSGGKFRCVGVRRDGGGK